MKRNKQGLNENNNNNNTPRGDEQNQKEDAMDSSMKKR